MLISLMGKLMEDEENPAKSIGEVHDKIMQKREDIAKQLTSHFGMIFSAEKDSQRCESLETKYEKFKLKSDSTGNKIREIQA